MAKKAIEIIGILNVTPDSFSDTGKYSSANAALEHLEQMFAEGADKVDIGAEATNPWTAPITADEEWQRLQPVLEVALPKYGETISLDTYHSETVERALKYGQFIINDVTGFYNPDMVKIAAANNLRCIASHLPAAAHGDIMYAHEYMRMDSVDLIKTEMIAMHNKLENNGIPASHIVLDPGIGFGKDMVRNWELLKISTYLHMKGKPIMIGASRKRMLITDPKSGVEIAGANKLDIDRSLKAAQIAIDACARSKNPLWLRVHEVAPHVALRHGAQWSTAA